MGLSIRLVRQLMVQIWSRICQLVRLEFVLWASWLPLGHKVKFAFSRIRLIWCRDVFWCGAIFSSDNRLGMLFLPTYLEEIETLLTRLSVDRSRRFKIVDIGANCGQFALTAAHYLRQMDADADILCIEPNPKICGLLRTNISQSPHVMSFREPLEAAISRSDGPAQLFFVPGKSAQGSFSIDAARSNLMNVSGLSQVEVHTVRLTRETIARYWSDGRVDLTKVDVEGHEDEVLDGISALETRYVWLETPHSRDGGLKPSTSQRTNSLDLSVVRDSRSNFAVSSNGNVLLQRRTD